MSTGLFKIRLLSAQFPTSHLLGSTDVFLLFALGLQKSRIQGSGYTFQSTQAQTKTILFDQIPSATLQIFGADSLKTIDSDHQTVYGEINLQKIIKDQPHKTKNFIKVMLCQKDGQTFKHSHVGLLELQITYYPKFHALFQITIQSAFLTHDTQLIGKMDPYAKVTIGETIHRTTIKDNAGTTPIWNEKFIFEVEDVNTKLLVEIKDKDVTINDLVGLWQNGMREEGMFAREGEPVGRALPIYFEKKEAGTVNVITKFEMK